MHIAEKCHTDIYIFPIMALDFVFSPQIKITLTCIRKGRQSGFFGIIVYRLNLKIAV